MKDLNLLCMGCMKIKPSKGTCPYCQFDLDKYRAKSIEEGAQYLQPQIILNGKYMLGKVLGQGGFGITYIGWDLNLEIPVAIKEYFPNGFVTRNGQKTNIVSVFSGNKELFYKKERERFLDEAKILAKFDKMEGIVSVKETFQENGTVYIVMEYLEGEDFGSFLARNGGRLPASSVFEMMRPVMKALKAVHNEKLIHRDISPDNIRITENSKVKLMDFGAAREMSGGEKSLSVLLKPGYAPEEQYRTRGKQGPWTDIYALCATMYRAITGVKPMESLDRIARDELKSPSSLGISMNRAQEYALMKGLAVLSENRWQSIEELYNAIYHPKPMTQTPPQLPRRPHPPAPPVPPTPKKNSSQPLIIALIVVLIALFGVGGVMFKMVLTDTGTEVVSNDDNNSNKDDDNSSNKDDDDASDAAQEEEPEESASVNGSGGNNGVADGNAEEPKKQTPVTTNEKRNATSNYYILPESNSRYIDINDVFGMSAWTLKLAKNEIYARHGRKFKTAEIQEYFDDQQWYSGTVSADNASYIENQFNKYERANVNFLQECETNGVGNVEGETTDYSGLNSDDYRSDSDSYLIYDSDSRYIDYSDIAGFSSWEVKLAKNEIYARHGRKFKNSDIQSYFNGQSWYSGTVSASDSAYIEDQLNDYEKANIKFLQQYE